MKKYLLLIIIAGSFCLISAKKPDVKDYIKNYSALAVAEMERCGVPASISMAQAILESASGTSHLALVANNHFGIKCGSAWTGETEYANDDEENECFRVYPSAEASWKDHSNLLSKSSRYSKLFEYEKTDYQAWAQGLSECGYATDKRYPAKLVKIIEDYKLYELDAEGYVPGSGTETTAPAPVLAPVIDETVQIDFERPVLSENGRPYIISAEGDSFASIAKEFDVFKSQLLRWNGLDKKAVLEPGTKIYLKKLRKAK